MAILGSLIIGAVLGTAAGRIWRTLSQRYPDNGFWGSFAELSRQMVAGDDPHDFFRQYARLLRLLGGYLVRISCLVGAAALPVVVFVVGLAPRIMDNLAGPETPLAAHPPQSLQVGLETMDIDVGPDGEIGIGAANLRSPARITLGAGTVDVRALSHPIAVSSCPWTCAAMASLGFESHQLAGGPSLLIVRPRIGDRNFLWPYVSDLEFVFWLSLIAGSLVMFRRKRGAAA